MGQQTQIFEQLWQKVVADDLVALEQIYRHFYPNLFQYALKIGKSVDLAEDAIQDTFLYLWQHRKEIGSIQSLQNYLFRSLRNTCFKLIQKRKNLHSLEEVSAQIQFTILPEDLNLTEIDQQKKQQIKEALTNLSPRQREIILLKFFNNLDYEEIGEVLDINYQSVVNHVHKAIVKLRKSLVLRFFQVLFLISI